MSFQSTAEKSSTDSIYLKDVFDSSADVLVIPHSTKGTLSSPFEKGVMGLGLLDSVPKDATLGNVRIVQIPKSAAKEHRYVAFACSVDDYSSSYAAVRSIGIQIARQFIATTNLTSFTVACPLLGTAAGGLDPLHSYRILNSSFYEATPASKSSIKFHTLDYDIYSKLKSIDVNSSDNSLQLAIRSSIELSLSNYYVIELAKDKEFYYKLAKLKYEEFKNYSPPTTEFFLQLYDGFYYSETTFQDYLRKLPAESQRFVFLKLCGELVAYIDTNAYNKQSWNEYADKRTVARSSVRQTNWIQNLIQFRRDGNNFSSVSPRVANALRYLEYPRDDINMISDNHRRLFLKSLFNREYKDPADFLPVFEIVRKAGLNCRNDLNEGIIISRILYLPEIKELWLGADENEKEEEILPTEARDDFPEENAPAQATKNISTNRTIKPSIHSDVFSQVSDEDLLNYNSYARSIAQFISHSETKPPLTIGILAPWGKGKTTLMKLIQKNIKQLSKNEDTEAAQTEKEKDNTVTTYSDFKTFLKKKVTELIDVKKLKHPTVWFNAWNFQKNEQIWAGFAEEIISQLIAQIPRKIDQEKAWLALNLKRLDRQKIRQQLHAILFRKFIPVTLLILLSVIGGILLIVMKGATIGWIMSAAPLVAALPWAVFLIEKLKKQKLDFDLSKYLKPAEYKEKMGYLYAVQEDLKLVLELLVEKEEPAVIFVDDLDRCSPNTTSELVEAINAFISGDLPHCYFILGQDAQMVAAALDVTYDRIGSKLGNLQNGNGSLGWFFMEKFIQLQFNIPVMRPDDGKRIMTSLFKVVDEQEDATKQQESSHGELDRKYSELIDKIKSSDNQNEYIAEVDDIELEMMKVDPGKAKTIREKIVDKAAESYSDQDSEVINLIEVFAKDLSTSPRMIKRFVNLYRFYRFIQFTGQNKRLISTDGITIGKWITLMIKWPQLVRAIQWDSERNFLNGITSMERANNFETELKKYDTFEKWDVFAMTKYGKEISWVADRGLYDFLTANNEDNSRLSNAVESSFW